MGAACSCAHHRHWTPPCCWWDKETNISQQTKASESSRHLYSGGFKCKTGPTLKSLLRNVLIFMEMFTFAAETSWCKHYTCNSAPAGQVLQTRIRLSVSTWSLPASLSVLSTVLVAFLHPSLSACLSHWHFLTAATCLSDSLAALFDFCEQLWYGARMIKQVYLCLNGLWETRSRNPTPLCSSLP